MASGQIGDTRILQDALFVKRARFFLETMNGGMEMLQQGSSEQCGHGAGADTGQSVRIAGVRIG